MLFGTQSIRHEAAQSKAIVPSDLSSGPHTKRRGALTCLAIALACFCAVQAFLPLSTTVQIGADEGFELAKATLCLNGHKLYSEVWNDQPPLHTWIVTKIIQIGRTLSQRESEGEGENPKAQISNPKKIPNSQISNSAAVQRESPPSRLQNSAMAPRLLTVGFGMVLLTSLFVLVLRISGLRAAILTVALLLMSPGFIELSSSCMLEIPALACAFAAMSILSSGGRSKFFWREWLAGAVFACALLIKLVPAYLLPLAAAILWFRPGVNETEESVRRFFQSGLIFSLSLAAAFVLIDVTIERGAFLVHFGQSWSSHFGRPTTFEYGSAQQHPFDWSILFKNWDSMLPAATALVLAVMAGVQGSTSAGKPMEVRRFRVRSSNRQKEGKQIGAEEENQSAASLPQQPRADLKAAWRFSGGWRLDVGISLISFLPFVWLIYALIVFSIHKPWWSYYYIHIALPLCWCAAIGLGAAFDWAWSGRRRFRLPAVALFASCALAWMGGRLYLQASGIRALPKAYETLAIDRIQRLGSAVHWMYADDSIYSFWTGVPMLPNLAVLPMKRFWVGDMSNDRVVAELTAARPEVILLNNTSAPRPFDELLASDYRLTFMDSRMRLYARKGVRSERGR
jgi:hypothetical protein